MQYLTQQQHTHTSTEHEPVSTRKFAGVTLASFLVVAGTLGYLDLLPESPEVAAEIERSMPVALDPHISPEVTHATATSDRDSGLPHATIEDTTVRRVVINTIGLRASIVTPRSTNIDVLDDALLRGAVHYPDSAGLGEEGNMLIFGHSSSLPIVHNQNFKLFNRLHELSAGDVVRVESNTHEYVYRVESVRMAKAEEVMVRFDTTGKRLTLVTCNNSFGDKSDRYVVEANFIGKYPLDG